MPGEKAGLGVHPDPTVQQAHGIEDVILEEVDVILSRVGRVEM